MLRQIIQRLAYNYYMRIRKRNDFSGSAESDYLWAEREIHDILSGTKPLYGIDFLLSKEDFDWLKERVKEIHGVCYIIYHDVVHRCAKIEEQINLGNIREAQEELDKLAEYGRHGMIVEMEYRQ